MEREEGFQYHLCSAQSLLTTKATDKPAYFSSRVLISCSWQLRFEAGTPLHLLSKIHSYRGFWTTAKFFDLCSEIA